MSLFVQGQSDYNKGKPPQQSDEKYLDGYARLENIKKAKEQEQGK